MNTQFSQAAHHSNLRIGSYHLSKTYGGLLEGKPGPEVNREMVQDFTQSLDRAWGCRAKLVIWPKGGEGSLPADELPAWICAAWATSDVLLNEGDHGSELVVIWFEASMASIDLEQLAMRVLCSIDWQKHATGFCY